MNRAVIYARFSTDLQNERSIDDQISLCRTYAEREGLDVIHEYQDAARSGASIFGRDGIIQLMADATAAKYDVLVVEGLDRISRDMEDLAGIHKRLSFAGVKILAVHDGQANTVLVGLRGLVGQMFREDNAHKVRRGLTGRVKDGLSAGGSSYGYSADPAKKGKLLIVEEEADVIRQIFQWYADGKSPRHIARDLNAAGTRAPRGTRWNASTINGSLQRGNGILHNSLYAGELVWNRVRMIKDPDTGKRVSRPNPPEQWTIKQVPELRIVADELWKIAQSHRRGPNKVVPGKMKRPKRLLSGLLKCGACLAGMSTMGTDRSGRVRIRCSAAHESHTCPDPKTFYLDTIEKMVVDSLLTHLRKPERLALFIETYQAERKRLAADITSQRSKIEREIQIHQREMDRLVDAIAQGTMGLDEVGDRIKIAKQKREAAKEELNRAPPTIQIVTLLPAAMQRYEAAMRDLHTALAVGTVDGNSQDAAFLREIVSSITVHRDKGTDAVRIEVQGYLNALLDGNSGKSSVWGTVVAGEGLEPPTRGL